MEIRPDGFMRLADVLSVKWIARFKPTMADVFDVVESNNKKRFELKQEAEMWFIRAV